MMYIPGDNFGREFNPVNPIHSELTQRDVWLSFEIKSTSFLIDPNQPEQIPAQVHPNLVFGPTQFKWIRGQNDSDWVRLKLGFYQTELRFNRIEISGEIGLIRIDLETYFGRTLNVSYSLLLNSNPNLPLGIPLFKKSKIVRGIEW